MKRKCEQIIPHFDKKRCLEFSKNSLIDRRIPNELWTQEIFTKVEKSDLMNLRLVCKAFYVCIMNLFHLNFCNLSSFNSFINTKRGSLPMPLIDKVCLKEEDNVEEILPFKEQGLINEIRIDLFSYFHIFDGIYLICHSTHDTDDLLPFDVCNFRYDPRRRSIGCYSKYSETKEDFTSSNKHEISKNWFIPPSYMTIYGFYLLHPIKMEPIIWWFKDIVKDDDKFVYFQLCNITLRKFVKGGDVLNNCCLEHISQKAYKSLKKIKGLMLEHGSILNKCLYR